MIAGQTFQPSRCIKHCAVPSLPTWGVEAETEQSEERDIGTKDPRLTRRVRSLPKQSSQFLSTHRTICTLFLAQYLGQPLELFSTHLLIYAEAEKKSERDGPTRCKQFSHTLQRFMRLHTFISYEIGSSVHVLLQGLSRLKKATSVPSTCSRAMSAIGRLPIEPI